MAEIEVHGTNNNRDVDSSIRVSVPHNNDSNCLQYRKIQFNNISLGIDVRDNCCILRDGSICIVLNIVVNNNSFRLGVKRFLEIHDFYDIGMVSSALQIYKCAILNSEIFYIHPDQVHAKCYRMPFYNSTSTDDSDSDGENNSTETSQYIVAVIIHSEM